MHSCSCTPYCLLSYVIVVVVVNFHLFIFFSSRVRERNCGKGTTLFNQLMRISQCGSLRFCFYQFCDLHQSLMITYTYLGELPSIRTAMPEKSKFSFIEKPFFLIVFCTLSTNAVVILRRLWITVILKCLHTIYALVWNAITALRYSAWTVYLCLFMMPLKLKGWL